MPGADAPEGLAKIEPASTILSRLVPAGAPLGTRIAALSGGMDNLGDVHCAQAEPLGDG
jgi:hypothetical protein